MSEFQGVKFSKNWKYLADIFIELSSNEKARDPRFIRAFVDVFTCDKSKPNVLVEAFKDFMKNVNHIYMKGTSNILNPIFFCMHSRGTVKSLNS